jgi:hypothetical protein
MLGFVKKINKMLSTSSEVVTIKASFPLELHDIIDRLFTSVKIKSKHKTSSIGPVKLRTESLMILNRVYYDEIEDIDSPKYSEVERLILYSIFSRHSNGYIRQIALRKIIKSNYYWTVPFLVTLMGDYVFEIINDINEDFDNINQQNLALFISQNKEYYKKTKDRLISYWSCYYRLRFPAKIKGVKVLMEDRYPGLQLIDKVKRSTGQY